MTGQNQTRRVLGNILLSGVVTLLLCLTAEIGLRVYDYLQGADPQARAYWYWAFKQDRAIGYRPESNIQLTLAGGMLMDTNSNGYREREFAEFLTNDLPLVACIGESSTWGVGTSNHTQTYPRNLEKELSQRIAPVSVLNAGVPGYTTFENLQQLRVELLELKPRVVLYMGLYNDMIRYTRHLSAATSYNDIPMPLAMIPRSTTHDLFFSSSLFSFAATRIYNSKLRAGIRPVTLDRMSEEGERFFRDNVSTLASLLKERGIVLVWIDQPIDQSKHHPHLVKAYENAQQVLHDELAQHQVPTINASAHYDYQRYPMIDDVHLSESGNKALAAIIAEQVATDPKLEAVREALRQQQTTLRQQQMTLRQQ